MAVKTIFAQAEEAQHSGLAGREQSVEYFNPIMRRPSACHKARGTWVPERGSPLDLKRRQKNKAPAKKVLKSHWQGGSCVRLNYHRWGWDARDKVLDGAAFNAMPAKDRCKICDHQFNES